MDMFAEELAAESFPVAGDREAIAEDRVDAAISALEARRAAVDRLRRIMGIG